MNAPAELAWAVALLAALLSTGAACEEQQDSRPNLILVLTDDQRWDTLGCTGSPYLPTPEIDRLAEQGIVFDNAYVTSSLCAPSRASILTGLYAHQHGLAGNDPGADPLAREVIFPEVLQHAGYETAYIGKWHLSEKQEKPYRGFDRWVSFDGQGMYRDQVLNVDGVQTKTAGYITERLTDHAVEWIEKERDGPFLLILAHKSLHAPYEVPPSDARLLSKTQMQLPESRLDPPESLPEHFRTPDERNRPFREFREEEMIWTMRSYYRLMASLDRSVGRLVGALESTGQEANTALLFTSDNGLMLGEHRKQFKRMTFEPSIRVPLVARFPGGLPAGIREDALALNVDVAPTLLDLAGIEVADNMTGRSLLDLYSEEAPPWREATLHHRSFGEELDRPRELALRHGRWKYMLLLRVGREEALFDLDADPDERRNLANEEGHADVLADSRRKMREQMDLLGVPDHWGTELDELMAEDVRREEGQ